MTTNCLLSVLLLLLLFLLLLLLLFLQEVNVFVVAPYFFGRCKSKNCIVTAVIGKKSLPQSGFGFFNTAQITMFVGWLLNVPATC